MIIGQPTFDVSKSHLLWSVKCLTITVFINVKQNIFDTQMLLNSVILQRNDLFKYVNMTRFLSCVSGRWHYKMTICEPYIISINVIISYMYWPLNQSSRA